MGPLIRKFFFRILYLSFSLFLGGCQLPYYLKSAAGQFSLLSSRVPVEKALQDPSLRAEEKQKLSLAQEARQFAEQELGLESSKNYTSYVALDRPYVTYVVSASPKWELKAYEWSYAFVGKMPYKGFFTEADAQAEEQGLVKEGFDTFLRGVSAYSTLGWFKDPILSSMLRYADHDLVNTIIHETTHVTLYIKNSADFNERFATWVGNKGTEMFYLKKEGPESPTVEKLKQELHDEKIFSEFISQEIKDLKSWYNSLPDNQKSEDLRRARMKDIQTRFKEKISPQLKSQLYARFPEITLNNARLSLYSTYNKDLHLFDEAFEIAHRDFRKFLDLIKSLESHQDPEAGLQEIIQRQKKTASTKSAA
ncbi:MAG: aminopeptidase [Proteobacteria bacterium]|nr:aminopeptidase [Pseudomonadota bacterium]